jgi:hypothetical protein
MSDQAQQFYLAETADGKFVSYTTRAPYFCFVEETEAEAIETADRALDLAARIDPEQFPQKSFSRTVTELTPRRVIHREPALVS